MRSPARMSHSHIVSSPWIHVYICRFFRQSCKDREIVRATHQRGLFLGAAFPDGKNSAAKQQPANDLLLLRLILYYRTFSTS
jgi:hypothetical protein